MRRRILYRWFWHHGPKTPAEAAKAIRYGGMRAWQMPVVTELKDYGLLEEVGARRICTATGYEAQPVDVTDATAPFKDKVAHCRAKLRRYEEKRVALDARIERTKAELAALLEAPSAPTIQPSHRPSAANGVPKNDLFSAAGIVVSLSAPPPAPTPVSVLAAAPSPTSSQIGWSLRTVGERKWVCASRGLCVRHGGTEQIPLDADGVCVECRTTEHKAHR